jgi:uncharacterized membrane protein
VFGYDLPLMRWFNWIHIFTLVTFFWVGLGLYYLLHYLLRGGKGLKRHAFAFKMIFIGGLVIAGAFTFLPGRIMHQIIAG